MPDWVMIMLGIINLWIGYNDRNAFSFILGMACFILVIAKTVGGK